MLHLDALQCAVGCVACAGEVHVPRVEDQALLLCPAQDTCVRKLLLYLQHHAASSCCHVPSKGGLQYCILMSCSVKSGVLHALVMFLLHPFVVTCPDKAGFSGAS